MFNWLQQIANWLIYTSFQVPKESKLGDALNFFVYDTIKILLLLFVIVFIMGIVNFVLKSFLLCPPMASSTFAPIEVPLRNSCLETTNSFFSVLKKLIKIYYPYSKFKSFCLYDVVFHLF